VLERGAVYIDSPPGSVGNVEVGTLLGVVREVGTQFEVRYGAGGLQVRVREGAIDLAAAGDHLEVTAGSGISLSSSGALARSSVRPTDEVWGWAIDLAPAFELEGATAMDFLDWVARETGLAVEFETVDLEAFARRTLLHGSVSGLSPIQAPDVVLPSCGLAATRDVERLTVRPAPK
jgi:hypothetical protein